MASNRRPFLALEASVRTKGAEMLQRMAERLYDKMVERAAVVDGHSLEALAILGHPYSAARPQSLHEPSYEVHIQEGTLYKAIRVHIINQYRIQVGVDDSLAPHVRDVIFGTRRMVARDFISGSIHEIADELRALGEESINAMTQHPIGNQG